MCPWALWEVPQVPVTSTGARRDSLNTSTTVLKMQFLTLANKFFASSSILLTVLKLYKGMMERKSSCCPHFHEKHHCLHNFSACELRTYTVHFLHVFVYVGFISLNKLPSAKCFQRALALNQPEKLDMKITHQLCLFKTITSDHCTRRK